MLVLHQLLVIPRLVVSCFGSIRVLLLFVHDLPSVGHFVHYLLCVVSGVVTFHFFSNLGDLAYILAEVNEGGKGSLRHVRVFTLATTILPGSVTFSSRQNFTPASRSNIDVLSLELS